MICELKHAKNKSSFGDGNYLPKVVIDDEEEGGILNGVDDLGGCCWCW